MSKPLNIPTSRNTSSSIFVSFSTLLFLIYICFLSYIVLKAATHTHSQASQDLSQNNLFAVQVSTNLVSKPCSCGFCDPSKGISVPEHVNSIGHDLHYEISTNYLPIISITNKGLAED